MIVGYDLDVNLPMLVLHSLASLELVLTPEDDNSEDAEDNMYRKPKCLITHIVNVIHYIHAP